MSKHNIYLVGFMGTGKTTIGRELAKVMGRKFIDVDLELEKRFGMSVNDIFVHHGEEAFRSSEQALAMELAAVNNRVVSTGGGTILNPVILKAFQGTGTLICLYTQRDDLVDRLQRTDKRPLLKGQSAEQMGQNVDRLLAERREVYGQVKIRIETTNLTPMTAAKKIHELVTMRARVIEEMEQSIDLS